MVEAGDLVEGVREPPLDLVDLGDPGLVAGVQPVLARVEPGLEELHQQPGDVDVVAQRVLDVVEGERRVPLLHVLRVGAEHGGLPPGQAGAEHQRVEAVDLVVAVPHGAQGVLEQLARERGHGLAVAEPELVDERRPAEALELVGPLVDDLDAHRGQHRQDLGERERRADPEHLQPGLAAAGVHLLVEGQVDACGLGAAAQRLQPAEVEGAGGGEEVLLVGLRERVDVLAGQAGAGLLAVLVHDRGREVVTPRAGRLGQPPLEVDRVDLGDLLAPRRVDHEVHVGGRRLGDPGAELHRGATQPVLEDRREPLTDVGVVAVAGQVDEHRDVAAVGVAPDEHPQLPPLARVHDGLGHRRELVDLRVEQLVARVGLQGVHQRLAGVAARVEADPAQHLGGLLPQQRDPGQRLGVGGAREQPEEAALTDHLAVLAELLDAHVVEERRPVDRGARVGLGQHQQGLLPGLLLDQRRELAERGGHVLVGAEDAEAGAGDGPQHVVLAVGLEAVLAVAEEGEVVVGQPAEQVGALPDLLLGQRRRAGLQLVDDRQHLAVHLLPVLDRLADVAQHPEQGLLDVAGVLVVGHPGDLDVHPGLADRVRRRLDGPVGDRGDGLERAGDVADHVELRVDDGVHVPQLAGQLHRQGVHEERHVVGDDLHDRVPARGPAAPR